jgi:hypothetical protein
MGYHKNSIFLIYKMQSLDYDSLFYVCTRLDMITLSKFSSISGHPIYEYIKMNMFWEEKIKILMNVNILPVLDLDELKKTYYILEKAIKKRDPIYYVVKQKNNNAVKILLDAGYDPSIYNVDMDNSKCAFYLAYKRLFHRETDNTDKIIFNLLKDHPRTDLFISTDIVNDLSLIAFLKNLVADALGGLIIGYYYSIPVGDHLSYPLRYNEYMTEIEYFLYVFLLYVIHTRLPIKQKINKLREMSIMHNLDNIIGMALNNVSLCYEIYESEPYYLYSIISGLNIYDNSKYNFIDIITEVRKKKYSYNSIAMIGKILGSHLGLKELQSQGLIINDDIKEHINKILSHSLDTIVNQAIVNYLS